MKGASSQCSPRSHLLVWRFASSIAAVLLVPLLGCDQYVDHGVDPSRRSCSIAAAPSDCADLFLRHQCDPDEGSFSYDPVRLRCNLSQCEKPCGFPDVETTYCSSFEVSAADCRAKFSANGCSSFRYTALDSIDSLFFFKDLFFVTGPNGPLGNCSRHDCTDTTCGE